MIAEILDQENLLSLIAIILTLLGIIWTGSHYTYRGSKKIYGVIKNHFSTIYLVESGYYSHDFVKNNIKNTNKIMRVICVRNIRITEPDILNEIKNFIMQRNGVVEILTLSPNVSDEIIAEIMGVLPKAPRTIDQFRKDFCVNYNYLFDLYDDLGVNKSHFRLFEFETLPLMHMCQFDDTIHLGFQLFYKEKIEGSLLDYCIEISAKSDVGIKILEQFDYLKNSKSSDLFKTNICKEYLRKEAI